MNKEIIRTIANYFAIDTEDVSYKDGNYYFDASWSYEETEGTDYVENGEKTFAITETDYGYELCPFGCGHNGHKTIAEAISIYA